MAQLGIDTNELPDQPNGEYIVGITGSDIHPNNAGTGKVLEFDLQILDGEFKGWRLKEFLNIQHEKKNVEAIANSRLKAIAQATGVSGLIQDTVQLHDKPFLVDIAPDKNNPQYSRVSNHRPLAGVNGSIAAEEQKQNPKKSWGK